MIFENVIRIALKYFNAVLDINMNISYQLDQCFLLVYELSYLGNKIRLEKLWPIISIFLLKFASILRLNKTFKIVLKLESRRVNFDLHGV
jgi:hypothetical protein